MNMGSYLKHPGNVFLTSFLKGGGALQPITVESASSYFDPHIVGWIPSASTIAWLSNMVIQCNKYHFIFLGKKQKKLTNVSLVCMYVGRKSEMSVFFSVFSPNRSNMSTISMVDQEKKTEKCQFLWSMYVCKAKTDICQFFFCFFLSTFPLENSGQI